MATLLAAQKTLNVVPVVSASIGGTAYTQVGRYKYREKAASFGRTYLWLDNTGGQFDSRPSNIERGKPVIITRGLQVGGQNLTQALPTLWVENYIYKRYKDSPYLVLDCIDWVGRLRYFRYETEQSWSGAEVQTIVSSVLGEVGLSLDSGSFTSLTIDYTISPYRSGWSAVRDLMSRIPDVLFAKPGGVVGFKTLDPAEAAGYDYGYAPTAKHPMIEDSGAASSTPRFNRITVIGGSALEYTGTAVDADEYAKLGYYRTRTIKDRKLASNAECAQRAEAELAFYQARSVSGVVVSRPHFTVQLYDVVSAEASPRGASVEIEAGHVTQIVEWFQFASRLCDQALTIGEVPDAMIAALSGDEEEAEEPIPPDDDPEDVDIGGGDDSGDTDDLDLPDESVGTDQLSDDSVTGAKIADDSIDSQHYVDGSIDSVHLADNIISNAKMQNDSITAAEIAAGAVDTSELAADAVTSAKIADNAIGNEHMQNDSVDTAEIAAGAVGTSELATDAVTGAKIADNAINSEHYTDGSIDPGHLATFPRCRVYRATSAQTIGASATAAVQWNAETFDTDTMHNNSTNNTRLVAKTAGYYRVRAQLFLRVNAGDESTEIFIRKNGSTEVCRVQYGFSVAETNFTLTIEDEMSLAVNDYVEIMVENNDGAATTLVQAGEGLSFCVMRLGP